jgi:hypothetical protein
MQIIRYKELEKQRNISEIGGKLNLIEEFNMKYY